MNGVQSNVAEEKRGAEHLLDGGSKLERLAQAERGPCLDLGNDV